MPAFLNPDDLAPFASIDEAKAVEIIGDVTAQAVIEAPGLERLLEAGADQLTGRDRAKVRAVKAILRKVVLREHEVGTGAVTQQQQSAGPFAQMKTFGSAQESRGIFLLDEVRRLRKICAGGRRAFTVDTVPGTRPDRHSPACPPSPQPCTCGAAVAGEPIFPGGAGTWPTFTGGDT